ncbi:MAG: NPCBM/NEW2 domain-containing protein, partial [Candidatus Sumerlaeia bacterium]|nr:NPCBM/NEW2 domain-containing protein [Candidatus Sumerlaeia bacterium]
NRPSQYFCNRTSGGRPITMQGKKYDKGIGMVSPAALRFYISEMIGENTDYRFRATVGLDDSIAQNRREGAAARFVVELDDKIIFDSGTMKWADGVKDVDVPIPAGARKLVLRVERRGEPRWDVCNWANARLERGGK